jgi:predicted nucleic acid-binding protein
MKRQLLLDTGVLVALLSKADDFHQWATTIVTTVNQPLLTCEAVITEACFLLQRFSTNLSGRNRKGTLFRCSLQFWQMPETFV